MSIEMGKRISELLQKKHMTQRELGVRVGVSEGVISRYVSGEREPKPEMVANIATALNVTSDYLLGIEHSKFDFSGICRIIARNSSNMSDQDKRDLINALFGEE